MQRLQTFTVVHGIGWVGFTSTCQLMHSCISRHQNTRPLAKANDPAGLYGHALSLVAKSDFSGAKEFLDKAGFCKFQCWTGNRTELKWSNGRLVTRIKLRLFALPLNGFGSLLLGLASRTSHSIASSICQALYNSVVEHDRCNHGTAWHLKINALHISSFESYSRSKSFAFAPSSLLGVIFICCSALAQSSRVRTLQVGGFEFSLSKHQLRSLFEFSQLGEWFPTNWYCKWTSELPGAYAYCIGIHIHYSDSDIETLIATFWNSLAFSVSLAQCLHRKLTRLSMHEMIWIELSQ